MLNKIAKKHGYFVVVPFITCVCRRGFSRMLYCFVPSLFELIFCVRAREYVKKKEARFVINKIFCYLCICVIAYLALQMLLCRGAFMEFFGAFYTDLRCNIFVEVVGFVGSPHEWKLGYK